MKNIYKKLLTSFIVATLLLPLFPVEKADAFFGECTVGAVCIFKDVYDNPLGRWVEDSTALQVGDFASFNIGVKNLTGNPVYNVNITDTLPEGLDYYEGGMTIYGYSGNYNELDLFGTGINIGQLNSGQSIQLVFYAKVKDQAPGTHTLTNTASVTSSAGGGTNIASVVVTATTPTPGKVLINEINHAPEADWSADNEYTLSGRGAIEPDNDQFIELYIKETGLKFDGADADKWKLIIDGHSHNLNASGAVPQYIGSGSMSSTVAGDYLLIGNPTQNLSNTSTIDVQYLSTSMDSVTLTGSTPTNLLDETFGRGPISGNTFSRNHGTPGKANTTRVANVYEAEIYMASDATAPHGVDTSDGLAVRLEPGHDLAGITLPISDNNLNAGSYKITLRAKVANATTTQLNSPNPQIIGKFFYQYDNAANKKTGFYEIGLNNFNTNNTYRDFVINITKPSTANPNAITLEFAPTATGDWDFIIDKITVEPLSLNPAFEMQQAEDFYAKAGIRATNEGRDVMFSAASSVIDPQDFDSVVSYNYTANQINGATNDRYTVKYYVKFANIPAGNDSDIVATFESRNHFGVGVSGVKQITRAEALAHPNYGEVSYPMTSDLFGSYQHRVLNRGIGDIYLDYVIITQDSSVPTTTTYEAEDLEYYKSGSVLYKPCAPVADSTASNNVASACNTADISAGRIQTGPFTYAQSTGEYYTANYYIKAGQSTDPTSNTRAASLSAIFVHDGGGIEVLASKIITEDQLSSTAYRNYPISFIIPTGGRMVYSVYFYDTVDILLDKVDVSVIGNIPAIRVYQAEQQVKLGGNLDYSDTDATSTWTDTADVSVIARDGIDQHKVISAYGPFETQYTGTYTADFYIKKSGAVGNSGGDFVKIEVINKYGAVIESDMLYEYELDSDYTVPVSLTYSIPSEQYVYYRVKFIGGGIFTSSDLNFDKVVVTKQ